MKKLSKFAKVIAVSLISLLCVSLVGCGSTKVIGGIEYDTHGLLNKEKENPNIQYKLVWGNIIWGAVLFETVVAPIYFYGFSIWEPIGPKTKIRDKR